MSSRSISLVLGLIIGVMIIFQYRSCQKTRSSENILRAQNDELKTYRNKLGQQVAERKVFDADYASMKQLINSKDSLVRELAKMVNKNTLAATIFTGKTSTSNVSKTETSSKADTIVKEDTVFVYAEYKTSVANEWEEYTISANKDSISLQHTTFNKFSIEQKYVNDGFLKPKAIDFKITNYNPNTITVDARSYLLHPKKEGRGIWLIGSFLAGFATFAVLHR